MGSPTNATIAERVARRQHAASIAAEQVGPYNELIVGLAHEVTLLSKLLGLDGPAAGGAAGDPTAPTQQERVFRREFAARLVAAEDLVANQIALGLAHEVTLLAELSGIDGPEPHFNQRAPVMLAVMRRPLDPAAATAGPGDLVMVEVPGNCTIHSADSECLSRIRSAAHRIGNHWQAHADSEQASPTLRALLDELSAAASMSSEQAAFTRPQKESPAKRAEQVRIATAIVASVENDEEMPLPEALRPSRGPIDVGDVEGYVLGLAQEIQAAHAELAEARAELERLRTELARTGATSGVDVRAIGPFKRERSTVSVPATDGKPGSMTKEVFHVVGLGLCAPEVDNGIAQVHLNVLNRAYRRGFDDGRTTGPITSRGNPVSLAGRIVMDVRDRGDLLAVFDPGEQDRERFAELDCATRIEDGVFVLARGFAHTHARNQRAIDLTLVGIQDQVRDNPRFLRTLIQEIRCELAGQVSEANMQAEKILALARKIGDHWRDQDGVNGALLEQLAEATRDV